MSKTKRFISLDNKILEIGVNKSIELHGNNRSFSKYLETLITKDNE
mgnify:CR=1 FL=1